MVSRYVKQRGTKKNQNRHFCAHKEAHVEAVARRVSKKRITVQFCYSTTLKERKSFPSPTFYKSYPPLCKHSINIVNCCIQADTSAVLPFSVNKNHFDSRFHHYEVARSWSSVNHVILETGNTLAQSPSCVRQLILKLGA